MLTWSSTDATACTASWSAVIGTSGSQSTGALTASSNYTLTCTGPGGSGSASATVTVQGAPPPPPPGSQDFPTRCAQPGVIKCVGFDSASDIAGGYGSNSGIFSGTSTNGTTPVLDTSVKASGASSLKFTILSNSGSDTSGLYFTNFSSDLSVQFGENSEFYIQWRQRFSPEAISTFYQGSEGLKQAIITTGDQPSKLYASCEAIGVVTQTYYQNRFPWLYNSCTGSTHHGPYDPFEEAIPGDFKLQNARPSPFCLYSQAPSNYFPPSGNCFGWFPDEWMTFQIKIKTGPRVLDEWSNSYVVFWMAREGKASEMVINWGPYYLTAGAPTEDQKFGKVFLLPYQTKKDSSQATPTAYTWYDELIISRNPIADPAP
jgi:hypothetical protein